MKAIIQWLNARLDKVAHFGMGYVVATILPIPAAWGLALAISMGVAKEYYDSQGNGTVDMWDFIATALGGIVGFGALTLRIWLMGA